MCQDLRDLGFNHCCTTEARWVGQSLTQPKVLHKGYNCERENGVGKNDLVSCFESPLWKKAEHK